MRFTCCNNCARCFSTENSILPQVPGVSKVHLSCLSRTLSSGWKCWHRFACQKAFVSLHSSITLRPHSGGRIHPTNQLNPLASPYASYGHEEKAKVTCEARDLCLNNRESWMKKEHSECKKLLPSPHTVCGWSWVTNRIRESIKVNAGRFNWPAPENQEM